MISSSLMSTIFLLFSSIVILWFITLLILEKKEMWPFLPFFLFSSINCFVAADLFIGEDITKFDLFLALVELFVVISYLFIIWRKNEID